MIISIHQPNFLPWLGYFHKVVSSDVFVILDDVQFSKGSVGNRTKIKSKKGEGVYLTAAVDLSKSWRQNYNALPLNYASAWNQKCLSELRSAYESAEFFSQLYPTFEALLLQQYSTLGELNIKLLEYFFEALSIKTVIKISSHLHGDFGSSNQRILGIVKQLGGSIYLSGNGARKYNDPELYKDNNIELVYSRFEAPQYRQINGDFLQNLSVIDALMNVGIDRTREMLGRIDYGS